MQSRHHAGPLARIALVLAAGSIALVACGESRAPYLQTFVQADADVKSDGSSGLVNIDSGGIPSCSEQTKAVCDCVELPLAGEPPNLYFVLDRSGSMAVGDKWGSVSQAVLSLVSALGPRANFGATVFPGNTSDVCSVGTEVMSTRPGDSPAGSRGPTWDFLHSKTILTAPGGGTPTSATIRSLLEPLHNLRGKTFVILATDGGPNCNGFNTCNADECIPNLESIGGCTPGGPSCCMSDARNCLDSNATVQAVALLQQESVPTYVVGIPGSAPYADLLNKVAQAGGTAKDGITAYYRVDSQDQNALLSSMKKVAAKILATCTIKLNKEPDSVSKLNLYIDELVVPQEPINGWTYEAETVTLQGTTCARVLAGDTVDVRVIAGCPTVITK